MRANTRMVGSFYRSLSLPCPKPSPTRHISRSKLGRTEKSYHVRSTSLPCRSHPIVSQLEDNIAAVLEWQSEPEAESPSLAWLCAGMAQLELLHESIDDLLQLPLIQESLRKSSGWTDKILDDFLSFADAHSTFRSALIALREHHAEAQIAFRRRDDARLSSCIRSQKRIEKELFKLASEILDISKLSLSTGGGGEADISCVLREVSSLTASSSSSIILGIAAASATTSAIASCSSLKPSWMKPLRRLSSRSSGALEMEQKEEAWRQSALVKLEALEECIGALECRNERVFRSMLNTRVSLLNMLTPTLF